MKKITALKITAVILTAVMVLGLFCGCKSEKSNEKNDGKLKIISTIFPPYDFARQVGGDKIDLSMLLKPGMESHNFEPSPKDIVNIQECDLFIYVGGESDEWVKTILESNDKKPKKIIALTECVDTVEEATVEGMTAGGEENEEGDEKEYDEHVWTSPKNAITITKKISSAMQEPDPGNKSIYEANTNKYAKELTNLDNKFREVTENAKTKTMIFGDRFPFRYFADEYGLGYFAAFPGCSAETEPSAATISFLIEKTKEKKIPVVFKIEFSNGKVAQTIADASGAKVLQMHSCHNVDADSMKNGVTYISLMEENLKNLKEALS